MPIHDWSKVYSGIYHDFRFSWVVELSKKLNRVALPDGYYSLIEKRSEIRIPTDLPDDVYYSRKGSRIGIRRGLEELVAVIDIGAPGNYSETGASRHVVTDAVQYLKKGIHFFFIDLFIPNLGSDPSIDQSITDELGNLPFILDPKKPLRAVSYQAGDQVNAFVESFAFGDSLEEMPLFIGEHEFIQVPMEVSYQEAWESIASLSREFILSNSEG
jgi:hypothetical protein